MMPLSYMLKKCAGAIDFLNSDKRLISLCIWTTSSDLQKSEKEVDTFIQSHKNIQP